VRRVEVLGVAGWSGLRFRILVLLVLVGVVGVMEEVGWRVCSLDFHIQPLPRAQRRHQRYL
jgi:hypothetical protein